MFRIVEHEQLAPTVHRMRVEAPYVAAKAQPGQFVILVVDDVGERVPFTISGWDREAGTVDFVFLEVGRTTRQMASLKVGDGFAHFIGPLGPRRGSRPLWPCGGDCQRLRNCRPWPPWSKA